MIYGIMGPQRTGKSKLAAALGVSLKESTGLPLYATNGIIGAERIQFYDDILEIRNCIFVWDEIDKDLQARMFKKNMEKKDKIMHWFTQAGKKDIILIWTTQFDRQVDIICKENTNMYIFTQKHRDGAIYTFYNTDTQKVGKKFGPTTLPGAEKLYDHKEYMNKLKWRKSDKTLDKPKKNYDTLPF